MLIDVRCDSGEKQFYILLPINFHTTSATVTGKGDEFLKKLNSLDSLFPTNPNTPF